MTNPAFCLDREQFVAAKLRERIPRPPYFTLMEKVNLKGGMPIERKPATIPFLPPAKLASEMKQGLVLDGRDPQAFAAGHIPDSMGIWGEGLGVFGGWVATETTSVYLVLDDEKEAEAAVTALARLGIDRVEGILAGGFDAWRDAGLPIAMSGTIAPKALHSALDDYAVLDVRDDVEFEDEGHVSGASHLYVGYLEKHLKSIEKTLRDKPSVALVCSVGHRAGLAASILQRHGFEKVVNVLGGMTAWNKLRLPTQQGAERSVTITDVEGPRQ